MPFHIWYQYKNFADTVYKLLQKSRVPTLRVFFFFFSPMWSTGPWNFDFFLQLYIVEPIWICAPETVNSKILSPSPDLIHIYSYIYNHHRYRPEIPEPASSFIPAWGSHWGYSDFFSDQNNRDWSGGYVLLSEREDKHLWNSSRSAKIMDGFCYKCLFLCVWLAKTWIPLTLTMPLHWVVYEFWDLFSISAREFQVWLSGTISVRYRLCCSNHWRVVWYNLKPICSPPLIFD